jgi:hypothetical protein
MEAELSIMKRRSTLSATTMGGGWPPELEDEVAPELELLAPPEELEPPEPEPLPEAAPESPGPTPVLLPPHAAIDEASDRSAAIPRR